MPSPDQPARLAACQARAGLLTAGYATTESFARGKGYEWVCATCHEDFAEEFRWESEEPAAT